MSGLRSYPLFIGYRYSFSRKRHRFTAIVAIISMLGMALGVASLIVVLSVMNGFADELRGRILSVVPHGYVYIPEADVAARWPDLMREVADIPGVVAVAPFLREQVLLGSGGSMQGARLLGIASAEEGKVSRVANTLVAGRLASIEQVPYSIVLGTALARMLGVGMGDDVIVTLPNLTVTPLGVFPRSKRLTVTGLFQVGAQQDAEQAYVSLNTAQRLTDRPGDVSGLQVKTDDLFMAPSIMGRVRERLGPGVTAVDWSQTQGSLFRAVRMEKITVALLLLSVVAVAAFNIVSTLVMSVTEKRADIAVLRTLGADARGIMTIFIIHGLSLALLGVSVGCVTGVALSLNIAELTRWVETVSGVVLFDPSVYFISTLPAVLEWGDVLAVVCASLGLGAVASVYPAWRASRIAPAEVLRYA
ncbi:MAG: lipoprotein-releasing ABC transporter permease subunit [Chromatocurvus sp.]